MVGICTSRPGVSKNKHLAGDLRSMWRVSGTKGRRPSSDSDTEGRFSRSSDSEALTNKIGLSTQRVCGLNVTKGKKGIGHIHGRVPGVLKTFGDQAASHPGALSSLGPCG